MIYLNIRKRPVVHITKKAITCGNHTVLTAHVSRIWTGGPASGPMGLALDLYFGLMAILGLFFARWNAILLFALLYACVWAFRLVPRLRARGLQLELDTGGAYCFSSNDAQFAKAARERILAYLASEGGEAGITVDFRNKRITDGAPPPPQRAPAAAPGGGPPANEALLRELRQYMRYCKSGGRRDSYALLEEMRNCILANKQAELRALQARFIQTGLIQGCNELGLPTLLNEVMNSIYHGAAAGPPGL